MTSSSRQLRSVHAVMWAVVACVLSIPHVAAAGPIECGNAELDRALRARGTSRPKLTVEVRHGLAETWSISPGTITGGDERGLMYGLLEAADQIRRTGTLSTASGSPATPLRGPQTAVNGEASVVTARRVNNYDQSRWYADNQSSFDRMPRAQASARCDPGRTDTGQAFALARQRSGAFRSQQGHG